MTEQRQHLVANPLRRRLSARLQPVRAGDAVWLTFRRYHVFDPASGARIRTVSDVAAA